MIQMEVLRKASTIQIKSFNFALAFQLKAVASRKLGGLYKLAKSNLGYRSTLFGLNKYKTMMHRQVDVNYHFAWGLLGSLENAERHLYWKTSNYQRQLNSVLHERIMLREWADVTTGMPIAARAYRVETKRIATKFWDDEDQGVLPILADCLEELDGAGFESDHLRSGFHSPACPIILRILKGIT